MQPGSRVYVDGRRLARVVDHFPKGSTSFAFPYVHVVFDDDGAEGERTVIAIKRISVAPRRAAAEPEPIPWEKTAFARK